MSGPSYTCTEILNGMIGDEVAATVFAARVNGRVPNNFNIVSSIPKKPFPYKPFSKLTSRLIEERFVREVARRKRESVVAYIWPGASVALAEHLASMGVLTVREMINTFDGYGDRIMEEAYAFAGLPPSEPFLKQNIELDRRILQIVDYAFAPNLLVEHSLREAGVSPARVLRTSYGWSPKRLSGASRALEPVDGATFLFVGAASIRKGAHLLLKYWARSGIRGRLVLAGRIDQEIETLCREELGRSDVVAPGFVRDMGALYRSADVFVFPTLEEGGPQVTYEAAGCGLPLLVSPMGAGRIAIDETNGLIREPYDEAGWVDGMKRLASDVATRLSMSAAAKESAAEFTWTKVGEQRRELLLDALRAKHGTA
jgi:glycosyltransferase involved in cell wall biosynthesis